MELQLSSINRQNFPSKALEVFRYQAANNPIYGKYLHHLGCNSASITSLNEIPFLPISFFKTHQIVSNKRAPQIQFRSSGTTQQTRSIHYITNLQLYIDSFTLGIEKFYGNPRDICFLALLPSYLENPESSLIFMVDHLIKQSNHPESAYLLGENDTIIKQLHALQAANISTIVIGVSHALLDLAEAVAEKFSNITFMETGGMKGRRKEITRKELHEVLQESFGVNAIHSEYGMTELLSQAYSKKDGVFYCPPWMQVATRPINQPFDTNQRSETGIIQVIDLANIHSCAFIETADLGKSHADGGFEVLGRLDNADLRGCNLLLSN